MKPQKVIPEPEVVARLELVRADHPGHDIACTWQETGRPVRFEATATSLDIHPTAVITDDIAELAAELG